MPRTGPVSLVILALALAVAAPVAAGKTSRFAPVTWERGEDGKWKQVDDPQATGATGTSDEAVANPTLDEIEQLLARRKHRAAKPRIIGWIKRNAAAPDRDRGLFL